MQILWNKYKFGGLVILQRKMCFLFIYCQKNAKRKARKRFQKVLERTKEKMKIAWVCDKCNWLTISDSKEHHKMDYCVCGENACDLEEYMCRWCGDPSTIRVIAKLKDGGKWKYVREKKEK